MDGTYVEEKWGGGVTLDTEKNIGVYILEDTSTPRGVGNIIRGHFKRKNMKVESKQGK
jgi:hypothetical protein